MIHDIFAKFPTPPCAKLLGWELLDGDAARGWARLSFLAREDFLNPAGCVQGGLLTAMLDDTMGPTILIASGGTLYSATIDLHVAFLAPARPGRIIGEGSVVQLGKTVGFVQAELFDDTGVRLARGNASVRLVPVERLPA